MTKRIKYLIFILTFILFLTIIYFLGPKPKTPNLVTKLPKVSSNLIELEKSINQSEKRIKYLRPENRARIVWADSNNKSKTKYSVVYLHGFSGTWMDGYPVNVDFAKRYGCNLFLARLKYHGIENSDPLLDLTSENYLASAAYAVAIGEALGDSVIIMSTSTGGTLALILAADHHEISSLILYSPNIDLHNKLSFVLTMHWGLQLARLIKSGKYRYSNDPPELQKYWLQKYRIEALVSLKNLVANTMNKETFKEVKQPVFLGYYYKNENEQDNTVSVKRELEMFDQLGTSIEMKRKKDFPNSGVHPIACALMSKDVNNVMDKTFNFAENTLKLKPLTKKKK